ncbi:hypothetical protein [Frankia sp. Cas8]|uniref:hypothetical protein n=1 Tax=unclassified Frankia TaxID=2632575 RepID=UPI003A102118
MAVSDHELVVELGMSKQELIRAVEAGVPPGARLTDFDGDVDLTLIWRVRDGSPRPGRSPGTALPPSRPVLMPDSRRTRRLTRFRRPPAHPNDRDRPVPSAQTVVSPKKSSKGICL